MSDSGPWGARGTSVESTRRRAALRGAWTATVVLALAVCGYLATLVMNTTWTMDADETVHAIEALRLHDDLADGRALDFLRHSYFPERWAPPVNDHLRWYPMIHAWLVQPFFAVLGPNDVSARLPSVFFLFGTALVFFALGHHLARSHRAVTGFLAAAFVLVSPNLLTFSAQSLIASSAVFLTYLALLLFLRSHERGHPRGRALVAGVMLGVAILTKYDHGGFLALVLGLAELARVRFDPRRFFASGAGWLFGPALLMVALWFAHPDKLASLGDSVRHPFYGSVLTILFDFGATWFVEYAPGLALGIASILGFVAAHRRLDEPALRLVWIWAGTALLFYASRGRYHFRYNIVEGPAFLLFAALALPEWADAFAGRRAGRWGLASRGPVVWGMVWVAAAFGIALGLLASLAPETCFDLLRGPARFVCGLDADHFGLTHPSDYYVDHFAHRYGGVASYFGASLAALSLGGFLLAIGRFAYGQRIPMGFVVTAFLIPLGFEAVRTLVALPERVDWELECHPELGEVHAYLGEEIPGEATVLLGGGWDQFTNNGVRWYLSTGRAERPPFEAQRVVGDMIGSLVFPAAPRVEYWVETLATAPAKELPGWIVLAEPGPDFRYRTKIGSEVAQYRHVLAARPTHVSLARRHFPELDLHVEVLGRAERPPGPLPAPPEDLPIYERIEVGEEGWLIKDESLRHFVAR